MDAMTGIIVILTVLSQTSVWIMSGLLLMNGTLENNNKVQKFFMETHREEDFKVYEIDGTVIDQPALHPVAMIATNAQASLAANGPYAKECVERFWNTPLRNGERRYYDNCLYLFALLALSGNYRIW